MPELFNKNQSQQAIKDLCHEMTADYTNEPFLIGETNEHLDPYHSRFTITLHRSKVDHLVTGLKRIDKRSDELNRLVFQVPSAGEDEKVIIIVHIGKLKPIV